MKGLSIRQPWAWLIERDLKGIENRTWATSYRGPILIHAAKGMTRDEYENCLAFVHNVRLVQTFPSGLELPRYKDLPRGGFVARASIIECVHERDKHLLCTKDKPWFTGPYGFILADVEPLPFRPYKGALGLFEVPDELGRAA